MVGDEDEPCLDTSLFMKRKLPNTGLTIFPKSGHCINLEERRSSTSSCWTS